MTCVWCGSEATPRAGRPTADTTYPCSSTTGSRCTRLKGSTARHSESPRLGCAHVAVRTNAAPMIRERDPRALLPRRWERRGDAAGGIEGVGRGSLSSAACSPDRVGLSLLSIAS